MTVVFIGGTNGLLSQETVRIILAPVLSNQDDIGCALSPRKLRTRIAAASPVERVFSMATYQSRLNGRDEVAEGTMAFHLEKPAGFQFKAGQYVDLSLINPPETDSEGIIRSFSIASAPYEDQLLVVTRMRKSAFKRVLLSTRKTSGESDLGAALQVVAESRLRVSPRHSPFYCRFQ